MGLTKTELFTRNQNEIAATLLERGADVHGEQGRALVSACHSGNRAGVELLLRAGIRGDWPADSPKNPIVIATRRGDTEIVSLLRSYSVG